MTISIDPLEAVSSESQQLEQYFTYRIARLNALLNQQGTSLLGEMCDLTLGQWRVMAAIGTNSAQTSKQLFDVTKIDPGLISRLVRQLEQAEHLRTERNETDRRLLNVVLTAKGKRLFRKVFPVMANRQNTLFREFSEDEFETLNRLLDKLQDAVSA